MNNTVPHGWVLDRLGNLVNKITSGGTPKAGSQRYYGGNIPFLKIDDITGAKGQYVNGAKQTITEEAVKETSAKVFPENTVITTMYGTIGSTAILSKPMATNQAIAGFLGLEGITKDYLYHNLVYEASTLASHSSQTTQANISATTLKAFEVLVPPNLEQHKIATILSSVDDVIEKTRARIDKLKDLKTGMMQELLTQGIGHTEFKDSPVGWIPKEWSVEFLDYVAYRGSGHTPSKSKPEFWNGGIDWVSLSDSNELDRLYISKSVKKISELGIKNSSAVMHPSGTVVMSRDAGIGKSAILGKEMAVSQHFIAWVCSEGLDNHFLYYLLQHWKPRFEAIAMGSTIKTIGVGYFKQLQIPFPSKVEQEKIASALRCVDFKIFSLEQKHEQKMCLKSALMQDLLTGKVRVKTNQQEPEVA